MKDILKMIWIMLFVLICIFATTDIISDITYKDEQIKILEQSLNEQIQEKQVYMNLLENKEEEK